jgi:hypothetical protein
MWSPDHLCGEKEGKPGEKRKKEIKDLAKCRGKNFLVSAWSCFPS